MSDLGNRVRAARAFAGDMTQKELAAQLPFSLSTLQRTEAGGRALDEIDEPGFVRAVSKATGLPPWFFTSDFDHIGAPAEPTDAPLDRLGRQLVKLQAQVREFQVETKRELEKHGRSTAHDRGRLSRIEKNLAALGEVILDDEGNAR